MVCLTHAMRRSPTDHALDVGLQMWDYPGLVPWLLKQMETHTLVFHNARFDLAVLCKWAPELRVPLLAAVDRGDVLDTRVLFALRYPLQIERTLAKVVHMLFNEDLDKGQTRTSFRRHQALSQAQKTYAQADSQWTLLAAEKLLEIPYGGLVYREKEHLVAAQSAYNGPPPDVLYSRAAAYLAWYLEPQGLSVDQTVVNELFAEYEHEEGQLCAELYHDGLMRMERAHGVVPYRSEHQTHTRDRRWNVAMTRPPVLQRFWKGEVQEVAGRWVLNMAAVRDRFHAEAERLSLEMPLSPKTGLPSLEYDFWKEYRTELPEDLQRYLELSKRRKYLSSFLRPLRATNADRVYPSYLIPGAETGRWACAKPNIQQQPKKLRRMYNEAVVGADYKSLECYTLAHAMAALGIKGAMLAALKEKDLHTFVAGQVGTERQNAKPASFGLGGGMGAKRFFKYMRYQCGLDVSYEQACLVRMKWLSHFRDVVAYLELFKVDYYSMCPANTSVREWLTDLGFDLEDTWPGNFALSKRIGGHITCVLPSGRVIPKRTFSQAANVFFQGIGAEVMTLAFVKLCERRLPVCAVVHDSAYLASGCDLHPATVKIRENELSMQLESAMFEALAEVCPLVPTPRPKAETASTFF
jgi:hypothetical protein